MVFKVGICKNNIVQAIPPNRELSSGPVADGAIVMVKTL